jgi:putative acetyltransferase
VTSQPPVVVREEAPADHAAVADLHERAFAGPDEAALVAALRALPEHRPGWSLVAVEGGRVVGHILFSRVALRGAPRGALALAPMAVLPDRQRRGIGGALVREGLRRAEAAGEPLVIVVGHPAYYPRFGFLPARPLGLLPPQDWPDEAWMALPLATHRREDRGEVVYAPPFGL